MGRPVQAYDDNGNVVWQADYDIYGNVRNLHGSRQFIPFRQLAQYEDEKTGPYYNRFRYYTPRLDNYISQDPIRLAGNNPTQYGYVGDCNKFCDSFGLKGDYFSNTSNARTSETSHHSSIYKTPIVRPQVQHRTAIPSAGVA
ncbi:RHS repeat-associated core domain-containing protein [Prevotella jejuni]|uniref:RHS repeat-associated core domain-containing protein n=1 Tax=Prevotella jejuni TaxID=1177574 RepID=UPI002010CB98|nr:RHS repeat-associated core domain-containing protein [Prevotella jejuni]